MTLESAAQMGEFRPTTPDGQPTVAAQLMQRAMPPSVPQVAQQAGIAGQIQAMRMKQAQEALMNQAMAQRPQGGVEALNPQVGNFAEGGIVGYSGKDESDVKDKSFIERFPEGSGIRKISEWIAKGRPSLDRPLLDMSGPSLDTGYRRGQKPELSYEDQERILETLRETGPMMDIPEVAVPASAPPARPSGQGVPIPRVGVGSLPAAAEMGPPVPTGSERQFEQVLAAYERSRPREVTPEQGYEAAMQANAQQRRFLQAMGVDPDMLEKQAKEVERRGTERGSYYESQAQAARDKAKRDSLKNFLLGASGRGFGDVMASSERAASGADAAAEAQAQRFMELKLQAQDAAVKERMLINRLQFETATGQFDKAMKTKQEIENNRQKFETAGVELRLARTKELGAEERQRLDRDMEARRLEATQRGQDLQYLAAVQRVTNPGDKQRLSELRALQTSITDQMKNYSLPKERRAELDAQLKAVNAQIASMAGLPTTGGATGATNVDLSQWGEVKTPR